MAATKMMNRIDNMARVCDAEKPTSSRHRVLYYTCYNRYTNTDVILCAPRWLYLRAYYNNIIIVIRSRSRSDARVWWFFFLRCHHKRDVLTAFSTGDGRSTYTYPHRSPGLTSTARPRGPHKSRLHTRIYTYY